METTKNCRNYRASVMISLILLLTYSHPDLAKATLNAVPLYQYALIKYLPLGAGGGVEY